jgi:hypothetical protein
MQKLQAKFKNVPKDTSLVLCSTNCQLNKEDTLSVDDIVLTCNNPEENRVQQTERSLKAKVFVLNYDGKPLMPCSYAKSKRMVKKGAAKVTGRFPFTIQLNFECENQVQELTLGIDTGYKFLGASVISEKEELLSWEIELRTDVSDKLSEKKMYRRNRRNRLWYRKPRWKNRANARKEGRLMPSVLHKVNTHISVIEKIKKVLPISKIILETGLFDMAKMKNDGIRNWEYQKGEMFGFENVKSYVLSRDNHKCQCGLAGCNEKLQVHHIKFRSQEGTDNPNNLITLCEKHHKQLHEGKIKLNVKKHKELKSATIMNVIRKRLLEYYPEAVETFGYETKIKIRGLGIDKSHINDAFVIANGKEQERVKVQIIKQKRRNNRCLQLNRKGFKPSIKKEKSKVNPGDLFWINEKVFSCKGMFNKGKYICFGSTKLKEYFKYSEVTKIFKFGSLIWN